MAITLDIRQLRNHVRGRTMEKGVPIRSISRSIAVLQAINRAGDASLMEISKRAAVPYPTACRIVQTLLHEGLIEREPARKRYRPTALVQSLSHGFQGHSRLVTIARPHIVALTSKVSWPISITTRIGQMMVVRDSTHSLTSMTLNNYYPGYTLPILECAAGRAHIAFADEDERNTILRDIRQDPTQRDGLTLKMLEMGNLLEEVRTQGYAVKGRNRYTATPGKTSSIAMPVFDKDGVAGAIVLIFIANAMKMEEAVAKYLSEIKNTADLIGTELCAD